MDRAAHKQLLLTRAAAERASLLADLTRVRQSIGIAPLLRALLGTSLLSQLFGERLRGGNGWAHTGLLLLKRYRLVAAALGMLTPLLRRRRGVRRLLMGITLGAAAWGAARWSRGNQGVR